MNAGRELDALVAKHVMGWGELSEPHCSECNATGIDPTDGAFDRWPEYSTSIAAAWEMVEKLGNWHGFHFAVIRDPNNKLESETWQA